MAKKKQEAEFLPSPINNLMRNYAVYVPSAAENFLARLVMFLLGGVTGLIFFSGLFKVEGEATMATHISDVVVFCLIGFVAMCFLAPVFFDRRHQKRDAQLRNQFRDLLDSLSASLSSGTNPLEAFRSAYGDVCSQYGEHSFIALEVKEILNGSAQNVSIAEMLSDFAKRSHNEDVESFANVFSICMDKGADLKSVVRRTHGIISDKMAVNDEIETKLASNKMQHDVMSIMPIGIVALLRYTNPAFADSFASPMGVLVNIVAIGIFLGSYVLGQKIMQIK